MPNRYVLTPRQDGTWLRPWVVKIENAGWGMMSHTVSGRSRTVAIKRALEHIAAVESRRGLRGEGFIVAGLPEVPE